MYFTNNIHKWITKFNIGFAVFTLFLYTIIRVFKSFLMTTPRGDESSFLVVFKLFLEKGFYEANVYGNSILFNLVSSLFYHLGVNELWAMKTTSLFSGLLAIGLVFYYIRTYFSKLPLLYKVVALVTSINILIVTSICFSGVNDLLIVVWVISFFILTKQLQLKSIINTKILVLFGLLFSFMLMTRLMSVLLLLPMFLVLTKIVYLKEHSIKQTVSNIAITTIAMMVFLSVFNVPSVFEKGAFSFHEKKLNYKNIQWIQLQYLSEISYEEGTLKYGKHVKPKQVEAYLVKNGFDALPATTIEAVFFDIHRTLRVFFREFVFLIKPFTRLMGLVFLFACYLFGFSLVKRKLSLKNIMNQDVLLFSFVYTCLLCLIIASYMEPRWLLGVLFLLPIVLLDEIYKYEGTLKKGTQFRMILLNLHLMGISMMNIPFVIKNLNWLF